MGAFVSKFSDVLRDLSATLQLSMLIPATLLVSGLAWLLQGVDALERTDSTPAIFTLTVACAVITVAYLLHAFNMLIIRLFEGYVLYDTGLFRWLRNRELDRLQSHHKRIAHYREKQKIIRIIRERLLLARSMDATKRAILDRWNHKWQDLVGHELEILEQHFPEDENRVMPTPLGNTIAAFEAYSYTRYGIDPAELWTRFAPTLVKVGYDRFVEAEKVILDFLINLLLVCAILLAVALGTFAATGNTTALLTFVVLFGVLPILFVGARVAAANWGVTVKAAFDLYRFDLMNALHLNVPEGADLRVEREMWREVSAFLAYGESDSLSCLDYVGVTYPAQGE